MIVKRGTVWHTYTMQSFPYKNPEKIARDLIKSGLFLSILTPGDFFHYLKNGEPEKLKLNIDFNSSRMGVSLTGHSPITESGVCDITKYGLMHSISLRLSQNKLIYPNNNFYSNSLICIPKPIITQDKTGETFLLPLLRLFDNGFAHITFIDNDQYKEELSQFIGNRVNAPLTPSTSITASLDYATLMFSMEFSSVNIFKRFILKTTTRNKIKSMHQIAAPLSKDNLDISGLYLKYTETLSVQHNLSEVARYIVAMSCFVNKKPTIKSFIKGRDVAYFFGGWQGKPNVFIFEHENQKSKSLENHKENKKLISSILTRSYQFYSNKKSMVNNHRDYRAFDDFNYFSEQAASLTLLSAEAVDEKSFSESFTEENLMLDNQIKSDLRGLISFFYESKIEEIKNEKEHHILTKIQEDIIHFEEWLRFSSKSYGEVQDYALDIFKSSDINQARYNINTLLKARIQVIQLKDTKASERSNRILTIAFGLMASTSLSPIIAKPLFQSMGVTKIDGWSALKNVEETIYFLTTVVIVSLVIVVLNKIRR